MELSLSSAALMDAGLPDLLAACERRGLAGIELVEGTGHGLTPPADLGLIRDAREAIDATGVELDAVFCPLVDVDLEAQVLLAGALGTSIVVPASVVPPDHLPLAIDLARRAGTHLLLAHDTDPLHVRSLVHALRTTPGGETVGLAWEVRPEYDDAAQMAEVLTATDGHLEYVRLHGGGPESDQQTGRGVGALMARLALARFHGPLVLTPSNPEYHVVWRAWLGAGGGWGCGSKQSDPSLVTLEPIVRKPTMTELDVRPVEPKNRLESIMGAYDALPPGGTLDLTVDHDPKCMYYTLQALHGDETFDFAYRESGPVVWRVEVQKLTGS